MRTIINIAKRYLVLPVGRHSSSKKMCFHADGEIVYELDVKLDLIAPDMIFCADLGFLLGREVAITIEPDVEMKYEFKDEKEYSGEQLYSERYRPRTHFTPARGFNNDPNGLVYYHGTYHMFYQHNPVDVGWGNMHWGHAVSDDMLSWRELEMALFPDKTGMMYSGSAVVDFDNRTGLKDGDKDVILLFYTAAGGMQRMSGGKRFTQCLAYSRDGGKSFEKYAGNPLLPWREEYNRDPKVSYNPEDDNYYMALYLSGNRYAIYASIDLIHWEERQLLTLDDDDECPDFYPLSAAGKTYWVFSGAHDRYLVGKLEGGTFEPLQPLKRLHYGNGSYAAQTFACAPGDPETKYRMSWSTSTIPDEQFACGMCSPLELRLGEDGGALVLCAQPISAYSALRTGGRSAENVPIHPGGSVRYPLSGVAQDIEIHLRNGAQYRLSLLGLNVEISGGQVKCGECVMPVHEREDIISLRLIVDTCSTEIYAGIGQAYMCLRNILDPMLPRLEVACEGAEGEIVGLNYSGLRSIWETTID